MDFVFQKVVFLQSGGRVLLFGAFLILIAGFALALPPSLIGINADPNPVALGDTLKITPQGVSQSQGNQVNFYCCVDIANCVPTKNNSVCDKPNTSFPSPYDNISCDFTITQEAGDYSASCIVSDASTKEKSAVKTASLSITGVAEVTEDLPEPENDACGRTETTDTFCNADGTKTAEIHLDQINYLDANSGSFKKIQKLLKKVDKQTLAASSIPKEKAKSNYDYSIEQGAIDFWMNQDLTANNAVRIEKDGNVFSFRLLGAGTKKSNGSVKEIVKAANANKFKKASKGNFEYSDSLGNGIDAKIIYLPDGVKQEFVMQSLASLPSDAQATNEDFFQIKEQIYIDAGTQILIGGQVFDGNTATTSDAIIFQDLQGNFKYQIQPASVWDSANNPLTSLSYTLEKTLDGNYILSTNVPYSWLNDASRQFPVTIDPTSTFTEASADDGDVYYPSPSAVYPPIEDGTLSGPTAWNYIMGYNFTPTVSGTIGQVCGYFSGAKTVKVWNSTYGELASTSIAGSGTGWVCGSLATPLAVSSGVTYYVGACLVGSGGYYRSPITALPRTSNSITINNSFYYSTTGCTLAAPTTITTTMYGMVDIMFSPYYCRNSITTMYAGNSGTTYYRTFTNFNTTAIPDNSPISNVQLKLYYYSYSGALGNIEARRLPNTNNNCSGTYSTLSSQIASGTLYATTTGWNSGYNYVDLGTTADTDLYNQLSSNYFNVGIKYQTEGSSYWTGWYQVDNGAGYSPTLSVTYVSSTPSTITLDSNTLIPLDSKNGGVKVSWTDATDETGYQVWRAGDGVNWINVSGTLAANTIFYNDLTTLSNNTYSYKVRTLGSAGYIDSGMKSIITQDRTAPSLPGNLAATNYGTYAGLSWTASTDETSYADFLGTNLKGYWRFEEYNTNLARGKTATTKASATYSDYYCLKNTATGARSCCLGTTDCGASYPSDPVQSFATDGSTSTLWCSGESFNGGENDWIYVDLGSSQTIRRVKISEAGGSPYACSLTDNYSIQVSNDASTWVTVYSGIDGNSTKDVRFSPAFARYVRLYATSVADDTGWRLSVQEFEVYQLDAEGSDNSLRALDSSGNANDGFYVGKALKAGKLGTALNSDSTSNYVTVADNSSMDTTGDLSLIFWDNLASYPYYPGSNWENPVTKAVGGGLAGDAFSSMLVAESGCGSYCYKYQFRASNNSYAQDCCYNNLTLGTWYNELGFTSSGYQYVYRNNADVREGGGGGVLANTVVNDNNLDIARTNSVNQEYTGSVDEVAVFNKTLSAQERADYYNRPSRKWYTLEQSKPITSLAWTPVGGVFDDFSDGQYTSNPAWTVVTGTWTVLGSSFLQSDITAGSVIMTGNTSMTDYVVDVNASRTAAGNANWGIILRSSSTANFNNSYLVWIDGSANLNFWREVSGSGTQVGSSVAIVADWTKPHNLKVIATGSVFKVYFDDALKGTFTDTTYSTGAVGVRSYQSVTNFGSFKASPLSTSTSYTDIYAPDDTVPSVPYGVVTLSAISSSQIDVAYMNDSVDYGTDYNFLAFSYDDFGNSTRPNVAVVSNQYAINWISASSQQVILNNLKKWLPFDFKVFNYTASSQAEFTDWYNSNLNNPNAYIVVLDTDFQALDDGTADTSRAEQWLENGRTLIWTGDYPFYESLDSAGNIYAGSSTRMRAILDGSSDMLDGATYTCTKQAAADANIPSFVSSYSCYRSLIPTTLPATWTITQNYSYYSAGNRYGDYELTNISGGRFVQLGIEDFDNVFSTTNRAQMIREYLLRRANKSALSGTTVTSGLSTFWIKNLNTITEYMSSASPYAWLGLTPNTNYSFNTRSRDAAGNYSDYSGPISTWTLAAIPYITSVVCDASACNVGYNLNGNPAASMTGVYINETTGNPGGAASGWTSPLVSTGTYSNTGLTPRKSYCYQIKARNNNSVETSYSSTICAPAVTAVDYNAFYALNSGLGGIKITWADVAGETSYYVYRSVDAGANWTTIASTLAAGTTSFEDSGVTDNNSLWYKVRAYFSAYYGDSIVKLDANITLDRSGPTVPASFNVVSNGTGATVHADVNWLASDDNSSYAQFLDSSMVVYWRFEEGSGTKALDSSGDDLNGKITGTPAWVDGKIGKALNLKTSVVTTPSTSVLNTDVHSIAFWIKFTQTNDGSWRRVFGTNPTGGGDRSPSIWVNPSLAALHWRYDPGNTGYCSQCGVTGQGSTFELNKWYFITGTKNGALFTYYVNGAYQGSANIVATKTAGSSAILLGDGSPWVNLDELMVFNRALTGADVNKMYQIGARKYGLERSVNNDGQFKPVNGTKQEFTATDGADITTIGGWSKDVADGSTYTILGNKLRMGHPGAVPVEARDYAMYTLPNEITTNAIVEFDFNVANANDWDFMFFAGDSASTGTASAGTNSVWSAINNETWFIHNGSIWGVGKLLTVGGNYHVKILFDQANKMSKAYVNDIFFTETPYWDTATTGLKKIYFGNYGYSSVDDVWFVDNLKITPLLMDINTFADTNAADINAPGVPSGVSVTSTALPTTSLQVNWTGVSDIGTDYNYTINALDSFGNSSDPSDLNALVGYWR
ncbi:MAG: LamG-like jellyroll fold domain-containing protein, partial [Candidatus Diapherotrites archaeon]|nr:LamG-like jellyroll fold domain-containing protein [Candidatus Diapherotrites archaeon]